MTPNLFEEYAVDCVHGLLAINLLAHRGRRNEANIFCSDYAENSLLFDLDLTHFRKARFIVISWVIEALVRFPQHRYTSSDKS